MKKQPLKNFQLLSSDYESSANESEVSGTPDILESRGNFSSIDNSFQVAELNDRILLLQKKHAQDVQRLTKELEEAKDLARRRKLELNNLISQFQSERESLDEKNRSDSRELSQLKLASQSFFSVLSTKSSKEIQSFDDAIGFVNNLSIDLISKNEKIAQLESNLASNEINNQEQNNYPQKQYEKQMKEKVKKTIETIQKETESKISNLRESLKKAKKKKSQYKKVIKGQSEKILQLQQSIDQLTSSTTTTNVQTISGISSDSHPESTISILEAKNAIVTNKLENSTNEIRNLTNKLNELEIQNHELLSTKEKQEKSINELQSDNEKLTKAYDDLSEKYKKASKENQDYKEKMISKETEIAFLDTNLRETKIQYENLLSKQGLPSNNASEESFSSQSFNLYNDAFTSISTLLENQSIELQTVNSQRKELISQLQNANNCLDFYDQQMQKLFGEKEAILDQKASIEKQANLQKIQDNNDFAKAFNDVLLILPKEVAEDVSQYQNLDLTRTQIFYKTVSRVVDYFSKQRNRNSSEYEISNNEVSNIQTAETSQKVAELSKINSILISHLGNTNRFLKRLSSNSRNVENNLNENLVGTRQYDFELIRKECARIGSFIDEYENKVKPENYPAVFDPILFQESTKSLLQFITSTADINDSQQLSVNSTPIKELIAMFDSVLLTNSILTNQLDESKVTISYLKQNNELHKRESEALASLQEWKRVHEKEIDEIFQQVSLLIPSNNDEYSYYSAAEYSEKINNADNGFSEIINQISRGQAELRKENESLKEVVQKLEEKVNQSKLSQKQNNETFYKKADKIIGNIEQNVIDRNEELQIVVDGLQDKIEEIQKDKEKIVKELQIKIVKIAKKRNSIKEKYEKLFNEHEEMKGKLNTEINSINEEVKKLQEMNESLNKSNQQLQQKLQHKTAKKLLYKEKYEKINNQNIQLLKEINQRSEDLSAKYDETISKLENELNETRIKKEEAENEIASYSDYKLNLQRQNASLIISERTLKLKLASLTEQIENERKALEAKESSMKISLKNQLSKETSVISDELMQLRMLLSNVGEKYLNVSIHPNTEIQKLKAMFNSAIDIKFNSKEIRTVNEILKLREKLNLNDNVSLADFIKNMNEKVLNQEKLIFNNNDKIESLSTENEKLKNECIKVEIYRRENLSWKEWSRSLLRQFYPSTTNDLPIETTKTHIEEIMLSSVSQRRLLNKLDLLRKEKFLLKTRTQLVLPQKPKTHYNVNSKGSAITVKSMRPILLVLACAHRIQNNI